MAEGSESTPAAPEHRHVPRLPHKLIDPTPVVLAGTLLWTAGAVWFGVDAAAGGQWSIQFWTSAAGTGLGVIGFGVFRWQRSAARRGSRGSWQGLSGLDG
ncbi:DUF2530 domain-containing protein [Saccharopolyspora sp. HNM0983]|uniref:DUF2530 domain-containing protein n=1 Tax=Saccharopolyspora montiporae TaxID=2781240 RepID=A0A929B9H6_9PSEU|nr:DUF2530 domain-containing protein [Saccharopolyspora sp. HNM0983]